MWQSNVPPNSLMVLMLLLYTMTFARARYCSNFFATKWQMASSYSTTLLYSTTKYTMFGRLVQPRNLQSLGISTFIISINLASLASDNVAIKYTICTPLSIITAPTFLIFGQKLGLLSNIV